VEWSYGYNPDNTGVFCCEPKKCSSHKYRESVAMGETKMSKAEVDKLILELKATWPGFEYDLLRHNCVIFSSFFCEQLGVGAIPDWVKNLCGTGEVIADSTAAKAVLQAAGKFDEEYMIREQAYAAAALAMAKGQKIMTQADHDGDGQVSMDEMKAYFKARAKDTPEFLQAKAWEFKEGAKAVADAIHKAADKDGDGKLTFKEAIEFLEGKIQAYIERHHLKERSIAACEQAKVALAEHQRAADTDGDGKISMNEAASYMSLQAGKCAHCEGCTVQ